jgi:hypothetical protein
VGHHLTVLTPGQANIRGLGQRGKHGTSEAEIIILESPWASVPNIFILTISDFLSLTVLINLEISYNSVKQVSSIVFFLTCYYALLLFLFKEQESVDKLQF